MGENAAPTAAGMGGRSRVTREMALRGAGGTGIEALVDLSGYAALRVVLAAGVSAPGKPGEAPRPHRRTSSRTRPKKARTDRPFRSATG